MSKLSHKQVMALRSGQVVWRVWFTADRPRDYSQRSGYNREGAPFIQANVERQLALGKKVKVASRSFIDNHVWDIPTMFIRKGADPLSRKSGSIAYLDDTARCPCFTSEKQARKYAADVIAGLYPKVTNQAIENLEFNERMDYDARDYSYDPTGDDDDGWDDSSVTDAELDSLQDLVEKPALLKTAKRGERFRLGDMPVYVDLPYGLPSVGESKDRIDNRQMIVLSTKPDGRGVPVRHAKTGFMMMSRGRMIQILSEKLYEVRA